MIKVRKALQQEPLWSVRKVEWSLLLGVVVVLALLFSRQVHLMQGQGELAAIRSTLGALRTAFVLDHLHKQVVDQTSPVALVQRNPFELLQRRPVNYLGEMSAAQAVAAPVGSWVYDAACACVGYMPIYAQWFDSPSGDVMAWYRVGGAPGPLQLTAKENYVWQGQVLN